MEENNNVVIDVSLVESSGRTPYVGIKTAGERLVNSFFKVTGLVMNKVDAGQKPSIRSIETTGGSWPLATFRNSNVVGTNMSILQYLQEKGEQLTDITFTVQGAEHELLSNGHVKYSLPSHIAYNGLMEDGTPYLPNTLNEFGFVTKDFTKVNNMSQIQRKEFWDAFYGEGLVPEDERSECFLYSVNFNTIEVAEIEEETETEIEVIEAVETPES